jgi:hypothetical protein
VVLNLAPVLLVTKEKTPTVPPGLVVRGFTLIDSPTPEDCAPTGAGTKTSVRHAVRHVRTITLLLK